MVDTTTAIEIVGDAGIAIGFLILYILSMRLARAFSRGTLDRLFKTVSLVLLLFAIRETLDVALLLMPVLQQAEVVLDVGLEIVFLLIVGVGIFRVTSLVRSIHPAGERQAQTTAPEVESTSDERVLAEVLRSALAALAAIMGPSVIYGVAARACLPILERTYRISDATWMTRFLPPELQPRRDPPTET